MSSENRPAPGPERLQVRCSRDPRRTAATVWSSTGRPGRQVVLIAASGGMESRVEVGPGLHQALDPGVALQQRVQGTGEFSGGPARGRIEGEFLAGGVDPRIRPSGSMHAARDTNPPKGGLDISLDRTDLGLHLPAGKCGAVVMNRGAVARSFRGVHGGKLPGRRNGCQRASIHPAGNARIRPCEERRPRPRVRARAGPWDGGTRSSTFHDCGTRPGTPGAGVGQQPRLRPRAASECPKPALTWG